MTYREIANTILDQLGGKRFIMMTGSKDFVAIKDGLKMTLSRNASRANRLEITLGGDDLYTMRFYKYVPFHLNTSTGEFIDEKVKEIKTIEGVFFGQLQDIFTQVTELYTRF